MTAAGEEEPVAVESRAAVVGESRWPMTIAVLTLMAFALVASPHLTFFPGPVLAVTEAVLLLAILFGDPGRIDRQTPWLRVATVALVVVLLASTLGSTALLVFDLLTASPVTDEPGPLLIAGAKVWLGNNVAFALLYWAFDCGGPAARAHGMPKYPDLAFPQQTSPDLAPPGWRPIFVDYLYLGFTNSTAFSPTDVMPLVPWAKSAMTVQSTVSLVVIGLVVARAVNILT